MNKAYIPTLFFVIVLAGLHFFANAGHWYVRYNGFDILMHILGGIGLGLAIYWILTTFSPKHTPSFWTIVLLTFLAGFAWEIFEAVNNIAGAPVGTTAYYVDTIKDLCDDTIGAIISAYFLHR